MTKFYKTRIIVEVLSEDTPLSDGMTLSEIDYAITEGDCVGVHSIESVTELTGKEVADELYAFGSTPDFFMLDDNGNLTEEGESIKGDEDE
jgi:hypothetical protein